MSDAAYAGIEQAYDEMSRRVGSVMRDAELTEIAHQLVKSMNASSAWSHAANLALEIKRMHPQVNGQTTVATGYKAVEEFEVHIIGEPGTKATIMLPVTPVVIYDRTYSGMRVFTALVAYSAFDDTLYLFGTGKLVQIHCFDEAERVEV